MAIIRVIERFFTTPPPQNIPHELQDWLRDEMDRLSEVTNAALDQVDVLRATPHMFLSGDTDDIAMTVVGSKFVNYSQGAAIGIVPIEPDQANGDITIPRAGTYRLTAYFIGTESSVPQNQTIHLLIARNGVLDIAAAMDITSVQTVDRSLSATFMRTFDVDDVIAMWVNATADLGILTVQRTTLELSFIQSAGLTPEPPPPNILLNSIWAGVSGSVGGANWIPPTFWNNSFWPPDEAIALFDVSGNGDNGVEFTVVNNRGYLAVDIDTTALVGELFNVSIFVDEVVNGGAYASISGGNVTVIRGYPAISPGFVGRVDAVYQITGNAMGIRFGGGPTSNNTAQFKLSRPQLTIGSDILHPYQQT